MHCPLPKKQNQIFIYVLVMINYMEEVSFSAVLHEEDLDGKPVFVADCVELGVSDFGDNVNDCLSNLKKGVSLLLEEAPEKRALLKTKEPVLVTRIVL